MAPFDYSLLSIEGSTIILSNIFTGQRLQLGIRPDVTILPILSKSVPIACVQSTLTSLLPTAMPISARSLSSDDIISVTLFFWWLDISFSFWSSESSDVRTDWTGRGRVFDSTLALTIHRMALNKDLRPQPRKSLNTFGTHWDL